MIVSMCVYMCIYVYVVIKLIIYGGKSVQNRQQQKNSKKIKIRNDLWLYLMCVKCHSMAFNFEHQVRYIFFHSISCECIDINWNIFGRFYSEIWKWFVAVYSGMKFLHFHFDSFFFLKATRDAVHSTKYNFLNRWYWKMMEIVSSKEEINQTVICLYHLIV